MNNQEIISKERIVELVEECESALECGETDLGIDCVVDVKLLLKEVLELREIVTNDDEVIKDLRESCDWYKRVYK